MSENGAVIAELAASARLVPAGLVTGLLESEDASAVRLGRAIRELQQTAPHVARDAHDGSRVIDPVTHDPAW